MKIQPETLKKHGRQLQTADPPRIVSTYTLEDGAALRVRFNKRFRYDFRAEDLHRLAVAAMAEEGEHAASA